MFSLGTLTLSKTTCDVFVLKIPPGGKFLCVLTPLKFFSTIKAVMASLPASGV